MVWEGRLVVERGKPKERSDEVDEAVSDAQAADRPREAPPTPFPHLTAKRTYLARTQHDTPAYVSRETHPPKRHESQKRCHPLQLPLMFHVKHPQGPLYNGT